MKLGVPFNTRIGECKGSSGWIAAYFWWGLQPYLSRRYWLPLSSDHCPIFELYFLLSSQSPNVLYPFSATKPRRPTIELSW